MNQEEKELIVCYTTTGDFKVWISHDDDLNLEQAASACFTASMELLGQSGLSNEQAAKSIIDACTKILFP